MPSRSSICQYRPLGSRWVFSHAGSSRSGRAAALSRVRPRRSQGKRRKANRQPRNCNGEARRPCETRSGRSRPSIADCAASGPPGSDARRCNSSCRAYLPRRPAAGIRLRQSHRMSPSDACGRPASGNRRFPECAHWGTRTTVPPSATLRSLVRTETPTRSGPRCGKANRLPPVHRRARVVPPRRRRVRGPVASVPPVESLLRYRTSSILPRRWRQSSQCNGRCHSVEALQCY